MEQEIMLTNEEVQTILDEYQKKQTIENLTGPGVSLISHLVLLILGFVFIVTNNDNLRPPLVVEQVMVEEIKLDKEIEEEIEEIEEDITEDMEITNDPVEAPSDVTGAETSPEDVSDEAPQTDDNADTEEVLDTVLTKSPLHFTGSMGGRKPAGRKGLVGKYGGSRGGQASVNKALRWLASVQNENGSWATGNFGPENGHPAHTGIALLVFLAHGETPLSEKYGKTVQSAMRWLATYATDSDLASRCRKRPMGYAHGIATYAISESYSMTKIPFMQTAMEESVAVVIDGQMANGGFGYGYTSGPRWDVSVAGWNFQALKAARMAGCTNEKLATAIYKSVSFCRKVGYVSNGKFAYAQTSPKETRPNMGGVGVVSMQLLGAGADKRVTAGCKTIGSDRLKQYQEVMANPSKWNEIGGHCLYGWYYDTQAMFNTQNKEKARWRSWRKAFETVLIRAQNPQGYWQTSGQHEIGTANTPGRVLSTCLAALQLEVYYRYLPSFDMKKVNEFVLEDGIDGVGDPASGDGMVIEIGE